MKVLHVVASVNREVGGPAVSVSRLASTLSLIGVSTSLATLNYERHGPQPELPGVEFLSFPAGALARLLRGWSPRMAAEVRRQVGKGLDIVHGHGLWMFPNLYARQAASAGGAPLVVSPRGMLHSWSLGRSAVRKAIAWRAYERKSLSMAALFHATSEAEADSIRALRFAQPIAVIPNGVDLPDLSKAPARSFLENRHAELRAKRWLLFLSRLHPKKGVAELLSVWKSIESLFPDWHLVLAGPDLDGYGGRMRAYANDLGLAGRTTFTGMLTGPAKACAFSRAELFVLPSHSENFGVSVAEALAHALPAITTKAAPWAGLSQHGCGWWIEGDRASLAATLTEALALPESDRRLMGQRGRELAAHAYSWERVAADMRSAYEWILHNGQRPEFIRTA